MQVDNNEIQLEVLKLFREGKIKEASKLQDTFLAKLAESGIDYCPCTTSCKFHGKCYECITTHRGHGAHLPACLHDMVNKKIKELSSLSEHTFKPECK